MSGLSIISLILFITSGIFFVFAIFVFGLGIYRMRVNYKVNTESLTILDEVMLIHTDEEIPVVDMKSE